MSNYIVYDNQGETFDRYTVFLSNNYLENTASEFALSLSHNFDEPSGVSTICYAVQDDHLGKEIPFESLPTGMRKHIKLRLA